MIWLKLNCQVEGSFWEDFDIHVNFQVNDHWGLVIKGTLPICTNRRMHPPHPQAAANMHIAPLYFFHCLVLIVILISFTKHWFTLDLCGCHANLG